ncbi:HAD-superfamily hydrolase [Cadophora sp. DSE1049]|nr:HAD-superfamily hydrolase [Cadophora sp. DSE1049]
MALGQGPSRPASGKSSSTSGNSSSTIAFVFDIDGVLIENKKALPGATETIKMLLKRRIPFVFLTNAGGLPEREHTMLLAQRPGIPGLLSERQLVQSHTPFRGLLRRFADKNVLALGVSSEKTRNLAERYCFNRVITTADMVKTFAGDIFTHLGEDGRMDIHKFGKKIEHLLPEDTVQISAILVFLGPMQTLKLDAQIVMSFLLSEKGVYPITSSKNGDTSLPNNGYLQDDQPKVYFCNMDERWATATTPTTTAQLRFKHALKTLWDKHTDRADLNPAIVRYGKPSETAFVWGERALQEWHKDLNCEETPPIRVTYMIGDDVNCDIVGAKNFKSRYDSQWKSILVETGVHGKGTKPEHEPDHIVPGVKEAVELALNLEMQNDEFT